MAFRRVSLCRPSKKAPATRLSVVHSSLGAKLKNAKAFTCLASWHQKTIIATLHQLVAHTASNTLKALTAYTLMPQAKLKPYFLKATNAAPVLGCMHASDGENCFEHLPATALPRLEFYGMKLCSCKTNDITSACVTPSRSTTMHIVWCCKQGKHDMFKFRIVQVMKTDSVPLYDTSYFQVSDGPSMAFRRVSLCRPSKKAPATRLSVVHSSLGAKLKNAKAFTCLASWHQKTIIATLHQLVAHTASNTLKALTAYTLMPQAKLKPYFLKATNAAPVLGCMHASGGENCFEHLPATALPRLEFYGMKLCSCKTNDITSACVTPSRSTTMHIVWCCKQGKHDMFKFRIVQVMKTDSVPLYDTSYFQVSDGPSMAFRRVSLCRPSKEAPATSLSVVHSSLGAKLKNAKAFTCLASWHQKTIIATLHQLVAHTASNTLKALTAYTLMPQAKLKPYFLKATNAAPVLGCMHASDGENCFEHLPATALPRLEFYGMKLCSCKTNDITSACVTPSRSTTMHIVWCCKQGKHDMFKFRIVQVMKTDSVPLYDTSYFQVSDGPSMAFRRVSLCRPSKEAPATSLSVVHSSLGAKLKNAKAFTCLASWHQKTIIATLHQLVAHTASNTLKALTAYTLMPQAKLKPYFLKATNAAPVLGCMHASDGENCFEHLPATALPRLEFYGMKLCSCKTNDITSACVTPSRSTTMHIVWCCKQGKHDMFKFRIVQVMKTDSVPLYDTSYFQVSDGPSMAFRRVSLCRPSKEAPATSLSVAHSAWSGFTMNFTTIYLRGSCLPVFLTRLSPCH